MKKQLDFAEKVLKSGVLYGNWTRRYAPNGCISAVSRIRHTVEIYEAEYNGCPRKKYARGFYNYETLDEQTGNVYTNNRWGGWDDGQADAVAQWEAKIDAATLKS